MNKQTENHIERLRQFYGSYSAAARSIGLGPRSFRRGRNGKMPRTAERTITLAGKLLWLRLVLRLLVQTGEVRPSALKEAMRKARTM